MPTKPTKKATKPKTPPKPKVDHEEVLCGVLGLSREEVRELVKALKGLGL